MSKYMSKKKVHKLESISKDGESKTVCKVHNKTGAFRACSHWDIVDCKLCLRMRKK